MYTITIDEAPKLALVEFFGVNILNELPIVEDVKITCPLLHNGEEFFLGKKEALNKITVQFEGKVFHYVCTFEKFLSSNKKPSIRFTMDSDCRIDHVNLFLVLVYRIVRFGRKRDYNKLLATGTEGEFSLYYVNFGYLLMLAGFTPKRLLANPKSLAILAMRDIPVEDYFFYNSGFNFLRKQNFELLTEFDLGVNSVNENLLVKEILNRGVVNLLF